MMKSASSWVDFRSSLIMWTPTYTCSGASACAVMKSLSEFARVFFIKSFLVISINCCLVSVTLMAISFAGSELDKLRLCDRRSGDNLSCLVSDLILWSLYLSNTRSTSDWDKIFVKYDLKATNKSGTFWPV